MSLFGLDYPTLWFIVVGGLFAGYAILDGFDLGAGMLHLFLRKEQSRRIALNAIGPVWDGNEVWLVIGGGALFAGFPEAYATLFSAFYLPFMLFLVSLIFRAVSIEFRSKEPMQWWRTGWDRAYTVSSVLMTVLLGAVVGNVVLGIPMDDQGNFTGTVLDLLDPYALIVALLTVAAFALHGGLYLSMKTEGALYAKLERLIQSAAVAFVVLFVLVTMVTLVFMPHVTDVFRTYPLLFGLPVLLLLSVASTARFVARRAFRWAFFNSALNLALLMGLVAASLYPTLLRNRIPGGRSLDIYFSAASTESLETMLIIAAIGGPLVIGYTAFVFYTFRGKVQLDEHSY